MTAPFDPQLDPPPSTRSTSSRDPRIPVSTFAGIADYAPDELPDHDLDDGLGSRVVNRQAQVTNSQVASDLLSLNPEIAYNAAIKLDGSDLSSNPLARMFADLGDKISGLKGNDLAAYENLEFYSRHVMAYGDPDYKTNSHFISALFEALQYTNDDLLVLGPRGSAKSQTASITYPTWAIGRNPLLRFIMAFASLEAQGLAFGRQLMHIIENNQRYIRIFGELKPARPEKWTPTEFIVERPTPPGGLKDPTVGIVGVGSAVPSKRANVIIGDDLVTQQNAYSATMRTQVIRFVYQTLFPILTPNGRRILVGSRWDPRDLYAHTAQIWGLDIPPVPSINLREFLG